MFSIRKFIVVLLNVAVCNSSVDFGGFHCVFSVSIIFFCCVSVQKNACNWRLGMVNSTISPFVTNSSSLSSHSIRHVHVFDVLVVLSTLRARSILDKSICSFHARQICKTDGSGLTMMSQESHYHFDLMRMYVRSYMPFLSMISIFHAIWLDLLCHYHFVLPTLSRSHGSILAIAVCMHGCVVQLMIWFDASPFCNRTSNYRCFICKRNNCTHTLSQHNIYFVASAVQRNTNEVLLCVARNEHRTYSVLCALLFLHRNVS